jgi:hypothetical protein
VGLLGFGPSWVPSGIRVPTGDSLASGAVQRLMASEEQT